MTSEHASRPLVYDAGDPAVMADPFPLYARLREEDPVHWSPAMKSWVITRYEDVQKLLVGDAMSVNRLVAFYQALPGERAELLSEIVHYLNRWVAFRDPPEHTRMRRVMRHAFTTPAVEAMRPGHREDRRRSMLLDRLEAGPDQIDLIRDFALLVPAYVIMDMLGVPRERLDEVKGWSDDMATFISGSRNIPDKYDRAARGCAAMAAYFRELIAEREANPRPGFLTDLIEARDEGDRLSQEELIATCILVLFAGHETTTNLIGNAVLALLKHPEELARLRADPSLIDAAIEEALRWDGPTNGLVRVMARDVEIGGKVLKEGQRVFLMINAANRDGRVFDDPDRFDIARTPNRHMTFGQGIHICIGARLAREEGRIAVGALVQRFPGLALEPGVELEWIDAMVPRGTRALPVRLALKQVGALPPRPRGISEATKQDGVNRTIWKS